MTNDNLEDVQSYSTWSGHGARWDRDPEIARYMTLPSLLSLLSKSRLHFTKLTDLRSWDQNEGTGGLLNNIVKYPLSSGISMIPSTPEFEAEQAAIVAQIKSLLEIPPGERLQANREQVAKWDVEFVNTYVSCWHENVGDTDFMWRIYAQNDHGIAVVSTTTRLIHSFRNIARQKVGFGFVAYPTLDVLIRESLDTGVHPLPPFLIKGNSFQPESEFRVFVTAKREVDSCDLDVDLRQLVQEIRISPLAPRWVDESVREMLDPICERLGVPKVTPRAPSLRQR